jgi:GDPmannose 4,6-dehydratase
MLNYNAPEDFVIATGVTESLQEFIAAAFFEAGMDWRAHVVLNPSLRRPSDLLESRANTNKARSLLNWTPICSGIHVARRMYAAECVLSVIELRKGEANV